MPKNIPTAGESSHTDANQQFSIIGVAGTLGTSDVGGTAKTVAIGVNPATGAMYFESTGGASGTYVNISTGTITALPTLNLTTGTLNLVTPGTATTSLGKAGANTAGTTDVGVVALGVRTAALGTAGTVGDGQYAPYRVDATQALYVNNGYLFAGEDLANNRLRVMPVYNYTHIPAALGTTIIKGTAAGILHSVTLNSAATATNVTTLFDSVAGTTATVIAIPAATTATVPTTLTYDVAFTNGLVVECKTAAGANMTVSWL